jgi:Protein of unknown function (DUF2783)
MDDIMTLNTEPHLSKPDDFYQALMDAHRGLSDEQSAALNAKLILLLANHIGNLNTLNEAIDKAKTSDLHNISNIKGG